MTKEFVLQRDCPATEIPAGVVRTLEKGKEVVVTQALGGSVTVRTDRGLFRVDIDQADALGEGAQKLFEAPGKEPRTQSGDLSEANVWEVLKSCYDPEIPVNIVDLGLIYDLQLEKLEGNAYSVDVKMTLTAQGCGMGPTIARDAQEKIESLPNVEKANVDIVWDPQWTPHMISPAGRKALGLDN